MTKTLTVATLVQKTVLEKVLLPEISGGFWKNARPADHADVWKGVEVVVGVDLGATGFDVARNYNFVNPEFFNKTEDKLLEAAKTVDPDITVKKMKKQLIVLNQILGSRLKSVGGLVTKLHRGKKQEGQSSEHDSKKTSISTVRKAAATFVESEQPVEV